MGILLFEFAATAPYALRRPRRAGTAAPLERRSPATRSRGVNASGAPRPNPANATRAPSQACASGAARSRRSRAP